MTSHAPATRIVLPSPAPDTPANWLPFIPPLHFLLILTLSASEAFSAFPTRPPILLGLAATLPVLLYLILRATSPRFRAALDRSTPDLRTLTLLQTWRAAGITFLLLYHRHLLPASFALPAGYGDIAVGLSAPLVAYALSRPRGLPRPLFLAWTAFGILDLVAAVSLGVLSSASPLGLLAPPGGPTTRLMGTFPLSLIPTFFVPYLLILHLLSLSQLRRRPSLSPHSD